MENQQLVLIKENLRQLRLQAGAIREAIEILEGLDKWEVRLEGDEIMAQILSLRAAVFDHHCAILKIRSATKRAFIAAVKAHMLAGGQLLAINKGVPTIAVREELAPTLESWQSAQREQRAHRLKAEQRVSAARDAPIPSNTVYYLQWTKSRLGRERDILGAEIDEVEAYASLTEVDLIIHDEHLKAMAQVRKKK